MKDFILSGKDANKKKAIRGIRANTFIEKRLERLRSGSERRGWSYDDFVVHVLEVLVILRHRHQARPIRPSTKERGKKRFF